MHTKAKAFVCETFPKSFAGVAKSHFRCAKALAEKAGNQVNRWTQGAREKFGKVEGLVG